MNQDEKWTPIANAKIQSYSDMDEESKAIWDAHMETQKRIFGCLEQPVPIKKKSKLWNIFSN